MTADELIRRWQIPCFYHFTDVRNLPLIKAHGGLLPLAELGRRAIAIPAAGGNEWSHDADERAGVDEYVHLCFFDNHPMEFRAREEKRIGSTRFLRIAADVILDPKVRFTADVSNKSGIPILTLQQAIQVMDFEIIYTQMDWWNDLALHTRRQAARKYEILVPKGIPLAKIKGL
jgi:hypothetical protein